MVNRRQFLQLLAVVGAWAGLPVARSQAGAMGLQFGTPASFSFQALQRHARGMAAQPYQEPVTRHEALLESIDYDAFQQIVYKRELGLGEDGSLNFPVQLFHLGRYFKNPVKIHVLDQGQAREILYRPDYFTFGGSSLGQTFPDDLGFSGFRLQEGPGATTDWMAFLGASYFRSAGELNQYGLSARGVAINPALSVPEEFPRFTEFWLEPGPAQSDTFVVYALLDGPSVSGAFRLSCVKRPQIVMDIQASLYPRRDIQRMGLAPLTSMFWYGEHNRHQARDWRPEIHDSDGLAMWTGAGERLWRPLNNPTSVMTNSFLDANPKGFGLLQRDRAFYHYEDDGVFYDRRPTVWIEPIGEWGEGMVQLVEIPTDDEIHDNIVLYWLPKKPVKAGSEWHVGYRLHWTDTEPYPSDVVARVCHTRLGNAGVPGQPRPKGGRKFVIDFEGRPLKDVEKLDKVIPVVSASKGRIDNQYALQVVGTRNWRAFFDLYVEGEAPVDLRLFLKLGDRPLTETWLYQYLPFAYR